MFGKILSGLLFFLTLAVSAVAQPFKTENISLSEGLSQSCVYSIVQDEHGFTWMATQDGLNFYDGLNFKIYRDDPFDTTTLATNFINCLFTDSRGWLWVGTQNHGINLFVATNGTFRRFNTQYYSGLGHDNIYDLAEDEQGTIYAATSKGISVLQVQGTAAQKAILHISKLNPGLQEDSSEKDLVYTKLLAGRQNRLWAVSKNKLLLVDTRKKVTQIFSDDNGWESIEALATDASGSLWIGTGNGLYYFDEQKNNFEKIGGIKTFIRSLCMDSKNNLWFGTASEGLFRIGSEAISKKSNLPAYEKIPLGNDRTGREILCIREDRINSGLMWVGTFAGGAFKVIPVFKKFYTDFLEFDDVNSPLVTCLAKDHEGLLWIGTPAGLLRLNRENKQHLLIRLSDDKNGINAGYISAIDVDRKTIWAGTESGIFRADYKKDQMPFFKPVKMDSAGTNNFVRLLYRDQKKDLFLVLRKNILKFDSIENRFRFYCSSPDSLMNMKRGYAINTMLIDSRHNCWIGSSMGLSVYFADASGHNDFKVSKNYYHTLSDTNSLRSQVIHSLVESSDRTVWIGTANGFTKAITDGAEIRFTNYSTAQNLRNNLVYGALEDTATGFLWLSTNGGLTRFDPAGNATFNFDINDGLQSNEFNANAFFSAEDGEMLFGGINGYTSFYPSQILTDQTPPLVYITGAYVPSKNLHASFERDSTKSLKLGYRENSFSVEFIALHYANPRQNQYAYKLEGFQDDWTYCGTTRQVNFSKLPPGEYTLRVMASNSDGVFSKSSDVLTIRISPPFYSTPWFYVLLVLLMVGILYLVHMYRLSLKLAKIKEAERIRKETAADFHDELGHKITTISWFSEILKKKMTPEQGELKSYLEKIIETSSNLYLTMRDLLWAMDPEKDSVYETYEQLKNFGHELFDHTGVEFIAREVNSELRNTDLPLSYKRHVLLIFKEVMHNSLRHASAKHTFLELQRSNGNITLRFGDDGSGFDTATLNGHGNGIKNVMRRTELIQAQADFSSGESGTVFELTLPLN